MFPYRVQYNESESDILNYNFVYKIAKTNQNTLKILKSKSTVYPPKHTRTDVSGHASGAVFRCASFMKKVLFYIFFIIFIYLYDIRYTKYNIRNTKYDMRRPDWPGRRRPSPAGRPGAPPTGLVGAPHIVFRISYIVFRISYIVYL